MRKNCIVVPIYKEFNQLSSQEILALTQLYKILGHYRIFLIGPANIEWGMFLNHAQATKICPDIRTFSNEYFLGIKGYNRLMISSLFFEKFKSFRYLLIFQLDAFVFRDEFQYWCNQGYDYLGSPWFEGFERPRSKNIMAVGNGGFSLRRIKGSIRLLHKIRMAEELLKYKYFNWKGIIAKLPLIVCKIIKAKSIISNFEQNYVLQEDIFWCIAAPVFLNNINCHSSLLRFIARILITNTFQTAPVETALKFSFETSPSELYKMNNNQLPFGCHAWQKHEPDFWAPFIEASLPAIHKC